MNINFIILAITLCLFVSCSEKPGLHNKVWKLVKVSSSSASSLLSHPGKDAFNVNSFDGYLRIYGDSSYTCRLFSSFNYGKCLISGPVLTMSSHDQSEMRGKITKLTNHALVIHVEKLQQYGDNIDLYFEARPAIEDLRNDAYSLLNNLWQLNATKKELNVLIQSRIEHYVKCHLLYFENVINQGEEEIDFKQFSGPLKFDGDSVALKPLQDVPDEWKRTFFDEEDMMKGYGLLEEAFKKEIEIPDTKNRLLIYRDILKQLHYNVYVNVRLLQPVGQ